jgi:hypothetical protein
MAPRAASHVEHSPSGPISGLAEDERDRALGLGLIPVRVELEILFTEPLLEPFHGGGAAELTANS